MGSPDGSTGVGIKKRGRNSPALSAHNGDNKRPRVGSTLPLSSSLPTSTSGSLAGFDPRPLEDLSSIATLDLWIRDRSSEPIGYPASAESPFIVLMESTVPGRNLDKYNPLTIADQIDEVVRAERTIHWNVLDQIKIVCSGRVDANLLISSHELRMAGYKAFLPISMIRKNATIRDIDPWHSPTTILSRLDPHSRGIVTAVRRRTNNKGAPSETIELTLETTSISFARCFCMSMKSCGSGIGATVALLRLRLSWASGVFCAPLADRLPGFVMLLFPLPGLSLSGRSRGAMFSCPL